MRRAPRGGGRGGTPSCYRGWISRLPPGFSLGSPGRFGAALRPRDAGLPLTPVSERVGGGGQKGCQMQDPRGPGAAAWRLGGVDPRKQSPGETNKLFGVKEGTALGVGEAVERTRETKTRARRASKGSGSGLARSRGPPGSAATGLMTALQGLIGRLPNIQVSAGMTCRGQVLQGSSPPHLCLDSEKPLYFLYLDYLVHLLVSLFTRMSSAPNKLFPAESPQPGT